VDCNPPLFYLQIGQSAELDAAAFPALGGTADGEPRAHGAAAAPAVWVSSWGRDGSTALKERLAQSTPTAAVGKHKGVSAAGTLQHVRSRPNHPDVSDGAPVPWVDTGKHVSVHCISILHLHPLHPICITSEGAMSKASVQAWIRSCARRLRCSALLQQVARYRSSMQRLVMRQGTMRASAMPTFSR
jgi:hypothetical protein